MKNRICKISLFSAILASVSALPVDARVVVNSKNAGRSYADAYNQVNAVRYQQEYLDATATNATTASATATLPVMVSDEKLAAAILSNSAETTVAQLENCAMIYPNGVFKWDMPESGVRQNQVNQCVAVVSLVDANTNAVLATTTLAAGDTMKCNIDSFPESGMDATVLSKTELPADVAPTMADVEAVMNQEQKQNAGIKIAASAIIHGLAGNVLAPKDAGSSGILGTGKNQLAGTAIGAVAGAGIEAASIYTGKVPGDTIKSAAINAEAGAVIGNMLAGQSSNGDFLVIKNCKVDGKEQDCVVGRVEFEGGDFNPKSEGYDFHIIDASGSSVKGCKANASNDSFTCTSVSVRLLDVNIVGDGGNAVPLRSLTDANGNAQTSTYFFTERYSNKEGNSVFTRITPGIEDSDNVYFKIVSATQTTGNVVPAYAVMTKGLSDKWIGGRKTSEWDSKYAEKRDDYRLRYRNSDGSVGSEISDQEKLRFTPTSGNASDGGLVDLSNPGRAKGTLTGAAAGGALGGFAGYQGAKSEITDRWTTAIREYEDSLSNFVCMTGGRFLSKYNDYVEIPEPNKTEE